MSHQSPFFCCDFMHALLAFVVVSLRSPGCGVRPLISHADRKHTLEAAKIFTEARPPHAERLMTKARRIDRCAFGSPTPTEESRHRRSRGSLTCLPMALRVVALCSFSLPLSSHHLSQDPARVSPPRLQRVHICTELRRASPVPIRAMTHRAV